MAVIFELDIFEPFLCIKKLLPCSWFQFLFLRKIIIEANIQLIEKFSDFFAVKI
jgi:hypothetical protein